MTGTPNPGSIAKCLALAASCFALTAIAADPPAVDLTRAEEIHMGRCFMCHGAEGESSTPLYPRLAGQHYQYVAKQLADFKAGRRASDTMSSMVQDLTEEEMTALGVFFEKKPTKPSAARDPELVSVGHFVFHRGNEYSGVAACASCHGENGHGTDRLPRLASQVPRYIENQLKSFDSRQRTNDNEVMHVIASRLTELEIKAVSAYIGTMK
ncbi:MAG TPA: c-type cytochrome [Rhodocyclaceae bacterium]|nr:c-type cytochrome [Rhodocyclaceae bacterium]